jgi:trehalose-phosphatase
VGIARQGEGELLRENGAHVVVRSLRELDQSRENAMDRMEPQNLPSALNHFHEIGNKVKNKRPAVFLDYDGTLTPIVSRPEDAVLSVEMRSLLRHLSSLCLVAVISGRDRADVEKLVGLDELIYAGSHGFDISGPDMNVNFEPAEGFLPVLDQAERELRPLIDSVPGASLERKRYAIAVHYRNVPGEEEVSRIKKTVEDLSRRLEGLKSTGGKKIIELRPDMDWDKGRAVLWLLEKLGADQPDAVPFYIGDDITDEDAFRILTHRGIGILVGEHGEPTYAKFKLTDVDEMKRFLHQLAAILK